MNSQELSVVFNRYCKISRENSDFSTLTIEKPRFCRKKCPFSNLAVKCATAEHCLILAPFDQRAIYIELLDQPFFLRRLKHQRGMERVDFRFGVAKFFRSRFA